MRISEQLNLSTFRKESVYSCYYFIQDFLLGFIRFYAMPAGIYRCSAVSLSTCIAE